MIEELKRDFMALRELFITIRRDYNTYNILGEHIELLSEIAPTFFTDLGEIMQRDWLLQVSRLGDLSESHGRKNLSIKLIQEELKELGKYTSIIGQKEDIILEYVDKLTDGRNRRLCHNDHEYIIQERTVCEVDEKVVNGFINAMQDYSDEVGIVLGLGPLDFSCSSCTGDVLDFLSFLKKAQRAKGDYKVKL